MSDHHLSNTARRALAHITGRTRQGVFANRLYDMPQRQWEQALAELQRAGIELRWTHGTPSPTIPRSPAADLHPDRDDGSDLTDWLFQHGGVPTTNVRIQRHCVSRLVGTRSCI